MLRRATGVKPSSYRHPGLVPVQLLRSVSGEGQYSSEEPGELHKPWVRVVWNFVGPVW